MNISNEKIAELEEKITEIQADYDANKKEYEEYKKEMSQYEGLADSEAEARKIEAERIIKEKEEAEEAAKAEEAARKEVEEKLGYETGITYEQLSRTPDDYKDKKVKFKGHVVQVIEGDGKVQLRVATQGNYGDVIFCEYKSSIVTSRVLEDDDITIYGVSKGLLTYKSTMGGNITIPSIKVDKID